ncbi:Helix-turn-helix domain-containing protein [Asanoa hainanensis]|uniref:Helix-turn-helix domain-containing protein n=1 Tax=Asanoa hainanensis TaxID=560556 RepID=A0A239IMA0_9ACTN|nr:helix-turn-helix domain-containing protein [Asanoa hainanensis]SNS93544.1 Helix-turn-helix domain-containing protein [Asanoa hainanensis]
MPGNEALREFLRARRARLTPAQVGIPDGTGPRRVEGLRREEVAQIVAVSVDYYTRFEQGRVAPSNDILLRVGQALRLSEDEHAHLVTLVHGQIISDEGRYELRRELRWVLDAMRTPAFVLGRCLAILGTNEAARRLLVDFDARPPHERNHARWVFLDPLARERYADWDVVARDNVASLRRQAGRFPDDRRLGALVEELTAASPEFARWWSQHDVVQHKRGHKRYCHPVVGDLTVAYEAFPVSGTDDQTLYVYSTEPGSASEAALERLLR